MAQAGEGIHVNAIAGKIAGGVVLMLTLVSCTKVSVSGAYVSIGTKQADLLQITESRNGTLLGSLVHFSYTPAGIVERSEVDLSGSVSGNALTLVVKSGTWLTEKRNLSAMMEDNKIVITTVAGQEIFHRGTPDQYEQVVAGLAAKASSARSALASRHRDMAAHFAATPAYTLSNVDQKIDESAGKCLPDKHVVKILEGNFAPITAPQRVLITRAADAKQGTCVYGIDWQFYSTTAHAYLSPGPEQIVNGPGLIFSKGVWHPQDLAVRLQIQPAELIAGLTQLIVYREEDAMGGTFSTLRVYAIVNGFGMPKTLLQTNDMNPLSYSVSDDVLSIRGDYFGPNACNACGKPGYEVRLRYDRSARQMAILDPTQRSETFFKSILQPQDR